MTLCTTGQTGNVAFLASDRLATQADNWKIELGEGHQGKTWTEESDGNCVGMAGAGDGEYVDSMTGKSATGSFSSPTKLLETLGDLSLSLGKTHMGRLITKWRGLKWGDLDWRAHRVVADMERRLESLMDSEFFYVRYTGRDVQLFHATACGTLARVIKEPLSAIGSGSTAAKAWRAQIESPFDSEATPLHLFADIACVHSLGQDVAGVGGIPTFLRLTKVGILRIDGLAAVLVTNLAGLYLAGGLARNEFEQALSKVLSDGKLEIDYCNHAVGGKSEADAQFLPVGPLPYSFWMKRVTEHGRMPIAALGPFSIYGKGLKARKKSNPHKPERVCIFLDNTIRGSLERPGPEKREAEQYVVGNASDYRSGGCGYIQLALGTYLKDGSIFRPAPWFLDPFGKLMILTLLRGVVQDCKSRKSKKVAPEIEPLLRLWTYAARNAWIKELIITDVPLDTGKKILDTADMVFGIVQSLPRSEINNRIRELLQ